MPQSQSGRQTFQTCQTSLLNSPGRPPQAVLPCFARDRDLRRRTENRRPTTKVVGDSSLGWTFCSRRLPQDDILMSFSPVTRETVSSSGTDFPTIYVPAQVGFTLRLLNAHALELEPESGDFNAWLGSSSRQQTFILLQTVVVAARRCSGPSAGLAQGFLSPTFFPKESGKSDFCQETSLSRPPQAAPYRRPHPYIKLSATFMIHTTTQTNSRSK